MNYGQWGNDIITEDGELLNFGHDVYNDYSDYYHIDGTSGHYPRDFDLSRSIHDQLVEFLQKRGMTIIPIKLQDELHYANNFLTIAPRHIMAVGNHIPPNTPVENALWYNECFEKMRRR